MATLTPQEQNFTDEALRVGQQMITLLEELNRMKGRYTLNNFATTVTDDKFTTPLLGSAQGPYPHMTQAKFQAALAVMQAYITLLGDGASGTKQADLLKLIG